MSAKKLDEVLVQASDGIFERFRNSVKDLAQVEVEGMIFRQMMKGLGIAAVGVGIVAVAPTLMAATTMSGAMFAGIKTAGAVIAVGGMAGSVAMPLASVVAVSLAKASDAMMTRISGLFKSDTQQPASGVRAFQDGLGRLNSAMDEQNLPEQSAGHSLRSRGPGN